MDAYTASSWRPPTQPMAGSILKAKKKRTALHSQPETHQASTLQTIREEHPLPSGACPLADREISTLRRKCAALEAQRDEAMEELGHAVSAPKKRVTISTQGHDAKIKALEAQRDEAFDALDQALSIPDAHVARIHELEAQQRILEARSAGSIPDAHVARIHELEAQKRILEERCRTLSAGAEQKRIEGDRHRDTCEQLNEALTSVYDKHRVLYAQHTELEAKVEALSASDAHATRLEIGLEAAQEGAAQALSRAVAAEKTVQTLLGVRTLIQSAPVGVELAAKTRDVLQSSIDVLHLASTPATLQACLAQVCSALADLGEEAAGHSVVAGGWLTKRDAVLRIGRP